MVKNGGQLLKYLFSCHALNFQLYKRTEKGLKCISQPFFRGKMPNLFSLFVHFYSIKKQTCIFNFI